MKESDLKKEIIDWFKKKGWPIRKNNNIGIPRGRIKVKTYQKGMPDLTVTIPREIAINIHMTNIKPRKHFGTLLFIGQTCDIEVKMEPNKPTKEQLEWLEETNEAGGIGILAYSLEDVFERLKMEGIEV